MSRRVVILFLMVTKGAIHFSTSMDFVKHLRDTNCLEITLLTISDVIVEVTTQGIYF